MTYSHQFTASGIAIIEYALTEDDLARMEHAFAVAHQGVGARLDQLAPDMLAWLNAHPALNEISAALLDNPARLVRAVAFNKTAATNWFVPWHQDRTIVVPERHTAAGFRHWSERAGEFHVEPPVDVLERMVTLRIHVDACDEDNGPLEAVPGSHTQGRLERDAVASAVERGRPMLCLAVRGDILAMRPLIVHRSQKAKRPAQRRVLHLDYAVDDTSR